MICFGIWEILKSFTNRFVTFERCGTLSSKGFGGNKEKRCHHTVTDGVMNLAEVCHSHVFAVLCLFFWHSPLWCWWRHPWDEALPFHRLHCVKVQRSRLNRLPSSPGREWWFVRKWSIQTPKVSSQLEVQHTLNWHISFQLSQAVECCLTPRRLCIPLSFQNLHHHVDTPKRLTMFLRAHLMRASWGFPFSFILSGVKVMYWWIKAANGYDAIHWTADDE